MGCQCAKSNLAEQNELTKDTTTVKKFEIDVNQNNQHSKGNELEKDDKGNVIQLNQQDKDAASLNKRSVSSANITSYYNERILSLINAIRRNPSSYSQTILDSMENITLSNERLIYKTKVKVTLSKGKPAFEKASELLLQMKPMSPLILKEEITIPLPKTKEEVKDINYFKQRVQEVKSNEVIDTYFRDLVKEPETSILLMIVDDIENNPGKKRSALLNPAYKYIGISSAYIEKTFVAYFAFSK